MSGAKPVDAVDPAKKTSTLTKPASSESTVLMANDAIKCYWNDEEFKNGDRVTSAGKTYEASNGKWVEV